MDKEKLLKELRKQDEELKKLGKDIKRYKRTGTISRIFITACVVVLVLVVIEVLVGRGC